MTAITCLIPAWNEAARIAAVLAAVTGHPLLARVLVIDDGSTDDTGAIALACGAEVLRTPGNLGKTAALALGLAEVQTPHVLLLDADLTGLDAAAVTALIAPVLAGQAFASLSLRGNAPLIWRWIGLDYISGERVLPMALLARRLADLDRLPRFGFEVFLNRLLMDRAAPVAVVRWPAVRSPFKAQKVGILRGISADIAMLRDIFRTIPAGDCLRQILALRRLRPGTDRPRRSLRALIRHRL